MSPGAPPVLSFRYFDAADKGRFGNLGLMTDDAGHQVIGAVLGVLLAQANVGLKV